MNVAVAPAQQRSGIATALLDRALRADDGRRPPRLHARGARLERRRDRALRAARLRVARRPARLLHGQPRGRADHVAGSGGPRRAVILGLGDVLRRDRRGASSPTTARSSRTSSPRRPSCTPPTAASSRRSPRGGTSSSSRRSCARRSAGPARRSTTSTASRSRAGPGLIGALLVGLAAAKGLAWGRGLPLVPVDHLHGHVASLYLQPTDLEPPFLCLLASGGHTLLLDVQDRTRVPRDRDDARRRRRRGVRQGRAAARARLPGRRGDRPARARRRPRPRTTFPVARVPGLDFSFSGVKTALLYAVRDRRRDLEAAARRPRRLVPARDRPRARRAASREAADGRARSRSSAASPPTPSSAPRCPEAVAAPLALCTDNAAMIASAGRYAEPAADPAPPGRLCGGVARCCLVALAGGRRGRDRSSSRPAAAARPPSPSRLDAAAAWSGLVGERARAGRHRPAGARRAHRLLARRPGRAGRRARRRRRRAPLDVGRASPRSSSSSPTSARKGVHRQAGVPVHARRSTASRRCSTRGRSRCSSARRGVKGVYPVRVAFPATVSVAARARGGRSGAEAGRAARPGSPAAG